MGPVINTPHRISLDISPNEADIAIVSIDDKGTPGPLNKYVLKEYGYAAKDIPSESQLKYAGFGKATANEKKPILFVVTVNGEETRVNLSKNLYRTLVEYRGWFQDKTLWIPLMGTGSGGLTLEESYFITVNAFNSFQKEYPTKCYLLLSVPSDNGKDLIDKISEDIANQRNRLDARTFVQAFKGKIYLAGSMWNGREEQLPRFLEQGIWETGYENDYYKEISAVKENDLIIVKSTYPSSGISYLRIKAIGLVSARSENGKNFGVDWKLPDLFYDIRDLGYYRTTIQPAQVEDSIEILSYLSKEQLRQLGGEAPPNRRIESIPSLISDGDKGIDYLEISKDVNAFARVVSARSFEPPLAIALFGKWGSGKSFFMRQLKEKVNELAAKELKDTYCKGIAHIHFNAWSYMDSNLWASIVTKIFEELNEYITENKKENIKREEIARELTKLLTMAKEGLCDLETKKDAVAEQIKSLETIQKEKKTELDDRIDQIRTNTAWNIINQTNVKFNTKEKIRAALNVNKSFIRTEKELQRLVPEEYWDDPDKTYQVAKSNITFLKAFFRKGQLLNNLVWLVSVIFLIVIFPILLSNVSDELREINFIIPQTVLSVLVGGAALWKRGEKVYKEWQPLVAAFWNIRENHKKTVNEELAKFEQKEKALKLEIEKNRAELLLIDEQVQKAETVKVDLEYRLTNAFATEALYSFIDSRSKSEDYKKHLGIISIIRKDFEILSSFLLDHQAEEVKNQAAEEFRKKFKKPLERIILYIDDLDRCPEENVVQVLEAVNLLMAYPLFVVIVGVDPRWIKNALLKKHALHFNTKWNDAPFPGEIIEPSVYLEKIFQVPFHLKDAKDLSVKEMIKRLAGTAARSDSGQDESVIESDTSYDEIQRPLTGVGIHPIYGGDEVEELQAEALLFTVEEIELMQDMSEILGNNPRAVKRFVNIFRIIKAHEEFEYQQAGSNELIAILFLLALPLGKWKNLLPSLERFILNDSADHLQLSGYLLNADESELHVTNLKSELDVLLFDRDSFKQLKKVNAVSFRKHYSFIRRFSFKEM